MVDVLAHSTVLHKSTCFLTDYDTNTATPGSQIASLKSPSIDCVCSNRLFGSAPELISKQPRGASPTRSRATSTLGAVKDWEAGEMLQPKEIPMTPKQVCCVLSLLASSQPETHAYFYVLMFLEHVACEKEVHTLRHSWKHMCGGIRPMSSICCADLLDTVYEKCDDCAAW